MSCPAREGTLHEAFLRWSRSKELGRRCGPDSSMAGEKSPAGAAPAGVARNHALGRLRGPARVALRPLCEELAALARANAGSRSAARSCGGCPPPQMPPVERRKAWCPDPKGYRRVPLHAALTKAPFGPLTLCGGVRKQTTARPRRKEQGLRSFANRVSSGVRATELVGTTGVVTLPVGPGRRQVAPP